MFYGLQSKDTGRIEIAMDFSHTPVFEDFDYPWPKGSPLNQYSKYKYNIVEVRVTIR